MRVDEGGAGRRRAGRADGRQTDGIHISGFASSGNRINQDARARRAAALIVERDLAEPVTDETIAAVWRALLDHAKSGDVDAASTVFEVVRLQRANADAGGART